MRDAVSSRVPGASIPARAGIGLRSPHYAHVAAGTPAVAWVEVHTENYFHDGGPHLHELERIRESHALSLHGVGLGLGSVEPIDRAHLERVKRAIRRFEPALVSEHACWGHSGGEHFNDLLPLPYTEESLAHMVSRVAEAQDVLGRRLLIENPSSYLAFDCSVMPEWEFLAELARATGCGLLLDVNNVYVSARNNGFDPVEYLRHVPGDRVGEIHLAGYGVNRAGGREILVDTHGAPVYPEVWALYDEAVRLLGPVPTLVEWDTALPELEVLVAEADHADAIMGACRALVA